IASADTFARVTKSPLASAMSFACVESDDTGVSGGLVIVGIGKLVAVTIGKFVGSLVGELGTKVGAGVSVGIGVAVGCAAATQPVRTIMNMMDALVKIHLFILTPFTRRLRCAACSCTYFIARVARKPNPFAYIIYMSSSEGLM